MERESAALANAPCEDLNIKSSRSQYQSQNNLVPSFHSPQCEEKFRRALRGVASKAFIKHEGVKSVLCLRPVNLLEFGASVNRQGLENCRTTRKILQYLDRNKEEFLKFEHFSKN